jgi:hypothetical protein
VTIKAYYAADEPAVEATVQVYRMGDELAYPEKITDARGVCEFRINAAEDLKVVISQDGHRRELAISATELGKVLAGVEAPVETRARGDVQEPGHTAELLAGVSLIVALAAFYISLRTAQALRAARNLTSRATETPRSAAPPTGQGQG